MRILAIILLFSCAVAAQIDPAYIPTVDEVQGDDVFYTPSRSQLMKIPVDSLYAYFERGGLGGGLTDGDYGDITVSSGGTVMNIDANTITATEIAANAVGSSEIATGAVGSSELASTTVSAGSYTNTNLTVDADGRITAASNGSSGGVTGTGVTNRVAYWNTSTTLDDFPLAINSGYTEFTQSTAVVLPGGAQWLRPSGSAGMIRYNSDLLELEWYDGSDWVEINRYNPRGGGSGITDGFGDITITHNAGGTPNSVAVTVNGTTFYHPQVHSVNSSTFKIRFFNSAGSAVTSTNIGYYWQLEL